MDKDIRIYRTKRGKSPFYDWLDALKDAVTRAKIRRRLDRLALGHYGDCKSLGKGIKEIRCSFGAGYRIYFVDQTQTIIVLLCAGSKSTQSKDIALAHQYWSDLKERSYE